MLAQMRSGEALPTQHPKSVQAGRSKGILGILRTGYFRPARASGWPWEQWGPGCGPGESVSGVEAAPRGLCIQGFLGRGPGHREAQPGVGSCVQSPSSRSHQPPWATRNL